MSYKDFDIINFNSPQMNEIMRLVKKMSQQNGHFLISGSAGTGKTSLAKYLTHISNNVSHECLVIDCLDDSNFNSGLKELNASNLHIIFENVEHLNLHQQKELLKNLKNSNVKTKRIFTTKKNLLNLVSSQSFLEELFYSISVINLNIPDLAARPVDLLPLINFYLNIHSALHSRQVPKVTQGAAEKLFSWSWPGNLRELENVIERAVILSEDQILEENIQFDNHQVQKSDFAVGMTLSEVEKQLILQTLELTSQNRTKAAQVLGISIRTLRNKLNEYKSDGGLCESNI